MRADDRGPRGPSTRDRRPDYILCYKANLPIAVIEAKDRKVGVGHGMQQALDYAEALDVPFAFSSNGEGFLEHDRTGNGSVVERELKLSEFPSPDELWDRYRAARGITAAVEPIITQDYHSESAGKPPRYYWTV